MNDHEKEMCRLLKLAAQNAYEDSEARGLWGEGTKTPIGYAAKIALMHSELSTLLRSSVTPSAELPDITYEGEAAANVFLRLLDYCHARSIDLGLVALMKHKFNTNQS